ncbi:MAG: hypothetical protein IKO99_00810 [Bacteroidales bacterium]|nr:hypothetical protein [Bacteroidales bacterium]
MLQKDKDREILNYAAAIVIGAVLAIIIKRLIEGEHKRNGSDFGVALLGGTVGAGVYALSKKNVKKKESFSTSNVNEYTASTDNQPNFTHKESAKFLSKNYLIYETDSENWFFDKACQNVIAVTDNPMNQRLLLNKGFTLTNEYVYSSQKCFSISLEKIIENKQGVIYIDFSVDACAGFAITGAKTEGGFGIGFDHNNIAFYGNKGALASFLDKKVSTYDSSKNLWTIIISAAAGIGANINYCPYLNDVRDLFGLSYSAEFGIGLAIRLTFDNYEYLKGIGIGWGTVGLVYTDSRNKGIIISHKELVELFSFNETNVILGYGYFDYCIGKDSKLVLKIPDFEFVTDIIMIDMRKNGKDFIISEKAFNLYKKKNE